MAENFEGVSLTKPSQIVKLVLFMYHKILEELTFEEGVNT